MSLKRESKEKRFLSRLPDEQRALARRALSREGESFRPGLSLRAKLKAGLRSLDITDEQREQAQETFDNALAPSRRRSPNAHERVTQRAERLKREYDQNRYRTRSL